MAKRNVRQDVIAATGFDSRVDQNEIFEIDRSTLVLQLRTLGRVINEGAEEIEMVAAERVFGKSLSRTLKRRAEKLRLIAKDLKGVLRLVERSQVVKPHGRSAAKPVRPLKRKERN
jgi:hypothetical protein